MKGLKKKRRIQVIVLAAVALVLAFAVIYLAAGRDAFQFFRSPSEVAESPPGAGETFRIGGLVKDGSMGPVEGVRFSFVITDGGADIPVRYVGDDPRPDLFGEGQGTVATGRYVDGVFLATELLAKHDETYMPKEVIDALKAQGVYVDPAAGGGTGDGS